MWLMPSFGRPHALRRLLDAPGGWPSSVTVLINADDPELDRYRQTLDALIIDTDSRNIPRQFIPWRIFVVPDGSRFADAVRFAFEAHADEPFYGIIDDDYWPVTPGWHEKMVAAAGPKAISIANNKQNFPTLCTCRVMGGELARAIGTIAPGKVRHNFSDDAWGSFAQDFHLLRPLEDVIVEHRHHLFNKEVKKDATYSRGSGDFEEDKKLYGEWRNSDERRQQVQRVAELLGVKISVTDFSKVKLAICVPIQNSSVDIAFHHSFHRTTALLAQKRISYMVQEAVGGSHIGKAREHVLWAALKAMPTATHLLFIDDDMGWDASLVTRLLAADHEFTAISGVKKLDTLSVCYNALEDPQEFHPVTKFMSIRHIGFAFVMLKRCVIERMVAAFPDLEYDTDGHGREWALFYDMMWKQPHKALPDRFSEDFAFCERWRSIGGKIWMDPFAALVHAGRKEYTGCAADLLPQEIASAA
jgi:hypothetical protein